ncbi:DUF4118 domain-containing protein, partial (plasmid) [Lacticaseibacillus paracasei]|uniref:DUF4118 domain-containing protein n=1 Tax=Lacticaseibacillus paracasei TaxID=1597 RepID=UPI00101861F5
MIQDALSLSKLCTRTSNINTVLLYILGVMVVSLLTHTKWSGFVTAICSVALFNFFF